MFDQYVRNIQAWTMRPDFFQRFPELMSDIPVAGSIPGTIDWHGPPPRRPRVKGEKKDDDPARQMTRWPPWNAKLTRKRQRSLPLLGGPSSPDSGDERRPKHHVHK
jgi:hypothetical protein